MTLSVGSLSAAIGAISTLAAMMPGGSSIAVRPVTASRYGRRIRSTRYGDGIECYGVRVRKLSQDLIEDALQAPNHVDSDGRRRLLEVEACSGQARVIRQKKDGIL